MCTMCSNPKFLASKPGSTLQNMLVRLVKVTFAHSKALRNKKLHRSNAISQSSHPTCVKNARIFCEMLHNLRWCAINRLIVMSDYYYKTNRSSIWTVIVTRKRYYMSCISILSMQNPRLIVIN